MVFGNRGLSVVLLAVGATVFCWVLLLAMSAEPTGAQTGGRTGETTGVTIRVQDDEINIQDDEVNIQDDEDNLQYDDDNIRQYDDDDDDKKNRVITVEEQTVIIRTIPAKPLPPTGGLPVYVMVGGSILAGAGLLAGRLAVRRGRQR